MFWVVLTHSNSKVLSVDGDGCLFSPSLTNKTNILVQDQFFTFPNFENNTQCKLCLHLSVKFPAHPFCSTHSLCRAGVNSWTPSLCGACIQMCNFILSNYKESVSFKSLMFKTFDLSLNKLKLVRVHPKSWSFKTDFFSTLKSICFSPNFPALGF